MDGRRFDALTRAAAQDASRRRVLGLLATSAAGGLAAGLLPGLGARAAAAAPGGGINAAAVTCSGNNFPPGSMACTQFWNEYIRDCGIFCPNGEWLPRAGCTSWQYRTEPAGGPALGPVVWGEPSPFGVCASRTTNWSFIITDDRSDILHYRPTYELRDPGACNAEFDRFEAGLWAHEDLHRANFEQAVFDANVLWTNRTFSSCGPDDPASRKATLLRLNGNISAAAQRSRDTIRFEAGREGPEPGLDCRKCWHACPSWAPVPCSDEEACCGPGTVCVPGGCRRVRSGAQAATAGSGVTPRYYPTTTRRG
jgi:hypothetical protein